MVMDWQKSTRKSSRLGCFDRLKNVHELGSTFLDEFVLLACYFDIMLLALHIILLTIIFCLRLLRNRVAQSRIVRCLFVFSFFSACELTCCWYSLSTEVHWLLNTFSDLFFSLQIYKSAFFILALFIFNFYLSIVLDLAVNRSTLLLIILRGDRLPFFIFNKNSSFYFQVIIFELLISRVLILINLTDELCRLRALSLGWSNSNSYFNLNKVRSKGEWMVRQILALFLAQLRIFIILSSIILCQQLSIDICSARLEKPRWTYGPVKFFMTSLKVTMGYSNDDDHWLWA